MTDAGRAWAQALGAKDFEAARRLVADDVDFRALTPGRAWEARGAQEVVAVLQRWFEPQDDVRALLGCACGPAVVDTEHVSYRLAVTNPDGDHEVEQQAYLRTTGGRITWLRVLCSGFRPVG